MIKNAMLSLFCILFLSQSAFAGPAADLLDRVMKLDYKEKSKLIDAIFDKENEIKNGYADFVFQTWEIRRYAYPYSVENADNFAEVDYLVNSKIGKNPTYSTSKRRRYYLFAPMGAPQLDWPQSMKEADSLRDIRHFLFDPSDKNERALELFEGLTGSRNLSLKEMIDRRLDKKVFDDFVGMVGSYLKVLMFANPQGEKRKKELLSRVKELEELFGEVMKVHNHRVDNKTLYEGAGVFAGTFVGAVLLHRWRVGRKSTHATSFTRGQWRETLGKSLFLGGFVAVGHRVVDSVSDPEMRMISESHVEEILEFALE